MSGRRALDPRRRRSGFTLIELLVVMFIIGLIVALITVAGIDGLRRAEERATQALIIKLESALNDRLDALTQTSPPINQTHRLMAAIWTGTAVLPSDERAMAIAKADYLRSELPDVFFVQTIPTAGGGNAGVYPLNFAEVSFPSSLGTAATQANYFIPIGARIPITQGGGWDTNTSSPTYDPAPMGTGIYGASYTAAGAVYKLLGYHANGYDGVDNNGDGFVDDWLEGTAALTAPDVQQIITRLQAHQAHDNNTGVLSKTARSEMLYALLVEGIGPLGSVFTRDSFTDREVQDIDNDGLPEFVDAWGQPIQFYRWPNYYTEVNTPAGMLGGVSPYPTNLQRGYIPYFNRTETRQQNPLDPNQMLVSPPWWSATINSAWGSSLGIAPVNAGGALVISPNAAEFMNHFYSIVEPNYNASTASNWDRSGALGRREFFSKFLVISGGPDKKLGLAQLAVDYTKVDDPRGLLPDGSGAPVGLNALNLVLIENLAGSLDPNRGGQFYQTPATNNTTGYLQEVGQDDISNQNLQAPGTSVR